jgi:hypothetical protein
MLLIYLLPSGNSILKRKMLQKLEKNDMADIIQQDAICIFMVHNILMSNKWHPLFTFCQSIFEMCESKNARNQVKSVRHLTENTIISILHPFFLS